MTDRLVWIDCEMTGLDLARDALVEIACLVTDGNLAVLDEGVDLVIKPPADAVDGMLPVVRDMHTTSGLINELASGVTLAEAQEQVLRYVRSHIPDARKVPLCGNSIATDRASWPVTCLSWTPSCTTGWWTCRPSRNSPCAGTAAQTSP